MTQNKVNIDLSNKTILITGGAGFIGAALIMHLLKESKASTIYIDDVVDGIMKAMVKAPERTTGEDGLPAAPYALYNLGSGTSIEQHYFMKTLQDELINAEVLPQDFDFEAHKKYVGMKLGDIPVTCADITAFEEDFGFKPTTDLKTGLGAFAKWFKEYYNIFKTQSQFHLAP